MRQMARRSGLAIGTVQSELKKLAQLNLITKRRDGNRLYYRANQEHPLFEDIKSLVLKTVGVVGVLKDALSGRDDIQVAFIFGSIANKDARPTTEVDLMVIGDIAMLTLTKLLHGITDQIGREINPYAMEPKMFHQHKLNAEPFISRIAADAKIFIIGDQTDLDAVS